MIIELLHTKGGKRRIGQSLCSFGYLKDGIPTVTFIRRACRTFGIVFGALLVDVRLKELPYKPCSLRRGGATHAFLLSRSFGPVYGHGAVDGAAHLQAIYIYIYMLMKPESSFLIACSLKMRRRSFAA